MSLERDLIHAKIWHYLRKRVFGSNMSSSRKAKKKLCSDDILSDTRYAESEYTLLGYTEHKTLDYVTRKLKTSVSLDTFDKSVTHQRSYRTSQDLARCESSI